MTKAAMPKTAATAHAETQAERHASAFRSAMAEIVSAVHVVTTAGASGRMGLTATSFASVSDAPPTVLVCIEGNSRTLKAIEANGVFCINTLAADGQLLAEIFASRRGIDGEARFADPGWGTLATGAPVLDQALAAFDCRLVAIQGVATHKILIGEVQGVGGAGQGAGLAYRRRSFEVL